MWGDLTQNSSQAIEKAQNLGFGIETDLRLHDLNIVLSHDPDNLGAATKLSELFPMQTTFALNIKMDGLLQYINVEKLTQGKYFFFDASLPELYKYKCAGLTTACRLSEFERELPWHSEVIWVDSFVTDWWSKGESIDRLSEDKLIVIVSPELHGREHLPAWEEIAQHFSQGNPNVAVCTDYPLEFESIL